MQHLSIFVLFVFLSLHPEAFSQGGNSVVIIADVSSFPDTSAISKSTKANIQTLNISKPYGDSLNPNGDSAYINKENCDALVYDKYFVWNFGLQSPVIITNALFPCYAHWAAPGDSIYIQYDGNNFHYSGKGYLKYQLLYEISKAKKSLRNPIPNFPQYVHRITLEEYLQLNQYYDAQLSKVIPIVESYKGKLTLSEYKWLKAFTVKQIEECRLFAFGSIPFEPKYVKKLKLKHSPDDHATVWDTTMFKYWGKWIRSQNFEGMNLARIEGFANEQFFRKYQFVQKESFWPDNTNLSNYRKFIYYTLRNNPAYKGLFRERVISQYLTEEIAQELGAYNWFAQSILKDYYGQPGFQAYKKWIKSLENRYQYLLDKHNIVPWFELEDETGMHYGTNNIKGKFVVVHFWYTGCEPCRVASSGIAQLQQKFKADSNVLFLYVNVEKDKKNWQRYKDSGIYVPKGGVQLWTGSLGKKHEVVKDFDASEFPTTRFIDKNNKMVIDYSNPFARTLSVNAMTSLIGQQSFRFKDGPYVFHGDTGDTTVYLKGNGINRIINDDVIVVSTDLPDKQIHIKPQKRISPPPATYAAVSKMVVLSDIEGNFTPFRELLQKNKVIDENFNWTFGDGHLVFAGDMFDRGEQVTECLWLIYSLEEKAKAVGGMVHFILGNHEIMNLSGNHKYTEDKYSNSAARMGKSLTDLYSEHSILGKWLRSKNIIEKIGDKLFVHAGISRPVNNLSLTIEQINELARPYYDMFETARSSSDEDLKILFSTLYSPFWYRNYYKYKEIDQQTIINNTLQHFNVSCIVTGHTVVGDTVSVHYGGKVINTDTRHAVGKSEALLIEGNQYYRVNTKGQRIPLIIEGSKQIASSNLYTPIYKTK